jgi:putative transposase
MVTPALGREMVVYLTTEYLVSQRRACHVVGIQRATVRYRPQQQAKRVERSAAITTRLLALAALRPRFGYRRLGILLRREGDVANHKRVYRLYRQSHLALRRKRRKRLAAFSRVPLLMPVRANQVWAMDFMQDALVNGRRFRTLNIVDVYTRECRAIEVDTSLGGARVVQVLARLAEAHGTPVRIMLDNGPEFTSKALDAWAYAHQVELTFSRPGKPTDNGYIESFNGKLRDECLNSHWFTSLNDARATLEAWRCDYNDARPHSALGQLAPTAFAQRSIVFDPATLTATG